MTDRPILFSGAMVRALLDGRKTQTRRVLKDQSVFAGKEEIVRRWPRQKGLGYGETGDRLWVREAWLTESRAYDDLAPSEMGGEETVIFEADAAWSLNKTVGRLRAGMHMPRWASRVTLTITDVRVQRLQDISEEDAVAEGVVSGTSCLNGAGWFPSLPALTMGALPTAKDAYRVLWDSINADRGFGWEANPWVVAVTFTVERRNIDEASS